MEVVEEDEGGGVHFFLCFCRCTHAAILQVRFKAEIQFNGYKLTEKYLATCGADLVRGS